MTAKPTKRPEGTTSNEAHGESAVFSYAKSLWDFVDGGHLAALSGAEVRVFIALWRRASFETGECFPSLRRLSVESGLRTGSVARALKGLERRKVIRRKRSRGGHPSKTTRYVLTVPTSLLRERGLPTERGLPGDTNQSPQGDQPVSSGRPKGSPQGDTNVPINVPKENDTNNTKAAASEAPAGVGVALDFLRAAYEAQDIAEPTLSELIRDHPTVTPMAVARLAAKSTKGDNPAGILVNRIRGGEGERAAARQTKPLIDEDLEMAEEIGVEARWPS